MSLVRAQQDPQTSHFQRDLRVAFFCPMFWNMTLARWLKSGKTLSLKIIINNVIIVPNIRAGLIILYMVIPPLPHTQIHILSAKIECKSLWITPKITRNIIWSITWKIMCTIIWKITWKIIWIVGVCNWKHFEKRFCNKKRFWIDQLH